jgi:hypothetical protein
MALSLKKWSDTPRCDHFRVVAALTPERKPQDAQIELCMHLPTLRQRRQSLHGQPDVARRLFQGAAGQLAIGERDGAPRGEQTTGGPIAAVFSQSVYLSDYLISCDYSGK